MDLHNAQRAHDNQEPNLVDPSKAIEARIKEITEAIAKNGDVYYKGKEYRAARHVHDWMDFESMYGIIDAAQTMDEMHLGKFVKTVVTKAIETAAENDIETNGV